MSTEKLSRRDFLRLSAVAAAGIAVAACAKTEQATTAPDVKTPEPTKKTEEATPVPAGPSTKQAPTLLEQVKAGKLADLDERLTGEPSVIQPVEKIGVYGGDMRLGTLGVADGAIFSRYTEYENLAVWNLEWTDVIPGIAKGFEVQDAGKTFVFQLRKGMKWSDGEPFTADDYLYWYEEASNKELNPNFSNTWSTKGGPVVVTKEDDYTIKWTFSDPYGLFLQRMATPSGSGMARPRHWRKAFFPDYADKTELEAKIKAAGVTYWYEAYGGWTDPRLNPDHPCIWAWHYTGKLGDSPQFIGDRNAYYFKTDPDGNQLPYIDRQVYTVAADTQAIVMMAVAGEISYQGRHVASLANKPLFLDNAEKADLRFIDNIGSGMNDMLLGLNLTHKDPVLAELFQNRDFRIALSHAINRQEIIDVVGLGIGQPWQGAPLSESPLYNETLAKQYTEYDPAKANEMLDVILPNKDSEGFRLRPDGESLGIVAEVTAGQQNRIDSLELIKGYWAAVGIRIAVQSEDRSLFYERKNAWEHDLSVWGGDGGMDVVLEPRWYFPYTNESLYAVGWQQWYNTLGKEGVEPPEAAKKQMALYDQLKTTPGTEAQYELMKEILQIAQEQFWVMGTFRGGPGYEICKNKFRNVPDPNLGSWLYPNPGPQNPCQYYWES
ncbi:MAG: ABC transporter substrate-binding protein [Anaerolineae bacterium]|nr:ABC transporter substrate-binding protein [Anaerolineae bacterium]